MKSFRKNLFETGDRKTLMENLVEKLRHFALYREPGGAAQDALMHEAVEALERMARTERTQSAILDQWQEERTARRAENESIRREENEACAKVAESYQWVREGDIAAAIRARMK